MFDFEFKELPVATVAVAGVFAIIILRMLLTALLALFKF